MADTAQSFMRSLSHEATTTIQPATSSKPADGGRSTFNLFIHDIPVCVFWCYCFFLLSNQEKKCPLIDLFCVKAWFGEIDLINWFSRYGVIVCAKIFNDTQTPTSKSIGLVSYGDPVSAQRAVEEMNGVILEGKKLAVQLKNASGCTITN